jgi:anaerobic selenocysteine-containing dehydrogenase
MSLERQVRLGSGEGGVRTASPFACGPGCGITAHVKDGVLVRVEPGDFPGTGHVCARGLSTPKLVYHPDRLKHPLKRRGDRGEGSWDRISWDEALDTIAQKLKEVADRYGPSSCAWVMDMMGILSVDALLGLIGGVGGTFVLPAGCGDSAGPCADRVCYGSAWWYGEDYTTHFDRPALCLVWGNNPAETDFFKWRKIRDAKEAGARLVVIDPRFSTTASKADEYLPIRPGTDGALALGMMNVILERGLHDTAFLAEQTVAPFLVRGDNGMFLRERDIAGGDSDRYVVWDARSSGPQPHDAPGVAPTLTGVYQIAGAECRPAFQLLGELVEQYPPQRGSEITGVPADTITRLAIEYATSRPVPSGAWELRGLSTAT